MTPIGLALPEGEYSMFYQQASVLHPQMAYGRSFMDNVRPFVAVRDVVSSVLVDSLRQGLEPPLKSRFRTMVNRYMFAPRSVTPMQGEGDLSPLIPPQGAIQNFAIEVLKVYDDMGNKAFQSPPIAQTGGKAMTKFEVQQILSEYIRTQAGMVGACIAWRKKEARLKLKIGLNHLKEITNYNFETAGTSSSLGRNVKFGEIPKSKDKYIEAVRKMSEAQNLLKKRGTRKKFYLVDPETIKDYNFVMKFRVNPQQRDSDAATARETQEKVAMYRLAPNIDQKVVDKILIRSFHDDETELLKEEEPPQMPTAPAQPEAEQPQIPSIPEQPVDSSAPQL